MKKSYYFVSIVSSFVFIDLYSISLSKLDNKLYHYCSSEINFITSSGDKVFILEHS